MKLYTGTTGTGKICIQIGSFKYWGYKKGSTEVYYANRCLVHIGKNVKVTCEDKDASSEFKQEINLCKEKLNAMHVSLLIKAAKKFDPAI